MSGNPVPWVGTQALLLHPVAELAPQPDPRTPAENLSILMREKGWSQRELGRRLALEIHGNGYAAGQWEAQRKQVRLWLRGTEPDVESAARLAAVFHVDPATFRRRRPPTPEERIAELERAVQELRRLLDPEDSR